VASFKRSPVALVLLYRSEPARSTKYILPVLLEKSVKFFYSTCIIKQEWLLELYLFIFVAPIDLFSLPIFRIA